MPISLSAKKSLRKSTKNKSANVSFKRKLKDTVKAYLAKPTKEAYLLVQSMLDKAKKNNIYHLNKISRLKSNYAKLLTTGKKEVVKVVKKSVAVKKAEAKKKIAAKKAASKVSKRM